LKNTSGKQQLEEPPIFFVDRTFGRYQVPQMLRDAGFVLRTSFEEYGEADAKIIDPVIIASCGLLNRVLLTGDQDLLRTWNNEIIQAGIAVFVTTENNEGPKAWAPRIIAAKDDIHRELRRRQKPFTANISKEGRITQVRVYDGKEWRAIQIRKKEPSNYERKQRLSG
jgi:hypothetical protein